MAELTQEQFLKDVATHQMHVLRNDEVYRHVRFKREGTMCRHFDLVTFPSYLVYSGDMGCFVFSRTHDMFEFFRTDRTGNNDASKLYINKGYWAQKLQAIDGSRNSTNSVKEFSPESFIKCIHEWRINWIRDYSHILNKEERRELWEAVTEEVLSKTDDGSQRAYDAANDFQYTVGDKDFQFTDLWEHDFTEYTQHFIWCCYAIAWGIKMYDLAEPQKEGQASHG